MLIVKNFNTSKSTAISGMFENCPLLESLDLSGWDVSNIKYINNMFYNCSKLSNLNISGCKDT